jgi:hypothetical protein
MGGVNRLGGLQPSIECSPRSRDRFFSSSQVNEVLGMRGLFGVFVVCLLGIAAVGFYQGWFQLSRNNVGNKSNVTLSVDQDKIRADEEKVKDKVHDLGQQVKEKTTNGSARVNEQQRVP